MSQPFAKLFRATECLGCDGEAGYFLADNGLARLPLLALSDASLERVVELIKAGPRSQRFRFDDLIASGGRKVTDRLTGISFDTGLLSDQQHGQFVFQQNGTERRELYREEKRRYDSAFERFWRSVAGGGFRLFLIKTRYPVEDSVFSEIDQLISSWRKRNKQACNYVVLQVTRSPRLLKENKALELQWSGKRVCRIVLSDLAAANCAHGYNSKNWNAIFALLQNDPVVAAGLASLSADVTGSGLEKSIREFIAPASRVSDQKCVGSADSLSADTPLLRESAELLAACRKADERYMLCYGVTKKADSLNDLLDLAELLQAKYPLVFNRIGGDVLLHLLTADPLENTTRFDDQYIRAIYYIASYSLDEAISINAGSLAVYRSHGRSFVRYDRVTNSLKKTKNLLQNRGQQGDEIAPVLPVPAGGFRQRNLESIEQFGELSGCHGSADNGETKIIAKRLHIGLDQQVVRDLVSVSDRDDSVAADGQWINAVCTDSIDVVKVLSLPEARICATPTGIAFYQHDGYKYAEALSDLYHYFRVAGQVCLKPPVRKIPQAWVLPRYGNNNYYHSLVDKLPALYGYHLLQLDCPILSTYELDPVELALVEKLGISRDIIQVDLQGESLVSHALLPDVGSLRPLFFRFCQQLGVDLHNPAPSAETPRKNLVYISRINSPQRSMANEADVEQLMRARGFDIVKMEEHNFAQQMEISAAADCIVAPHGAGLANMIFMKKGSKVIELIPENYMTPLFRQLAVDCGHSYGVLVGQCFEADAGVNNQSGIENQTNVAIGSVINWKTDLQRLDTVLEDVA